MVQSWQQTLKTTNLWLQLSDGRTPGVPLACSPEPESATPEQRAGFELSPRGIHRDGLDEHLSLKGLLVARSLQPVQLHSVKKY